MKKTAMMTAALTLAALMGCEPEPEPYTGKNEDPEERALVSFSTGISTDRSVGRAVGTKWEPADAIGVFMLESGETALADNASNRRYVTSAGNGSFAPANEDAAIYYPADRRGVDFIAYYPYAGTLQGFEYPVNVSDQTSQAMIDLMTADRVSAPAQTASPVALTFKHRLSRLELEIKPGTNLTDDALSGLQVEITGQRVTGKFNINANTLIPEGAAESSIRLNMAEDGKAGEGILLPGDPQAGRQLIFTLGSRRFSYTIPAKDEFKPETRNKYTITLKGAAPSPSPDISVEGEVKVVIEDWGEDVVEKPDPPIPSVPCKPDPPDPPHADMTIAVGYDRETVTLTDEAGNPAAPGITLSKAQNASVTLKAGAGFEGIVWYLDAAGFPGQTFTLKAAEQEVKTYSITFTGWRNNSYLSSEIILCTVTP